MSVSSVYSSNMSLAQFFRISDCSVKRKEGSGIVSVPVVRRPFCYTLSKKPKMLSISAESRSHAESLLSSIAVSELDYCFCTSFFCIAIATVSTPIVMPPLISKFAADAAQCSCKAPCYSICASNSKIVAYCKLSNSISWSEQTWKKSQTASEHVFASPISAMSKVRNPCWLISDIEMLHESYVRLISICKHVHTVVSALTLKAALSKL